MTDNIVQKKISIIIPAYNVGKYIKKCISSICSQKVDRRQYEVIIIDDGSQDNTRKKIISLQKDFSNIILICQNNSGPSAARNKGLDVAKGDFIWFVDSDDYVAMDSLHYLLKLLEEHSPDILQFNHKRVQEQQNSQLPSPSHGMISRHLGEKFLTQKYFSPMVWLYIYKRELLVNNNLRFLQGLLHEDEEFTPKAIFYAKEVLKVSKVIYYYRKRASSITTSTNNLTLKIESQHAVCRSLAQFIAENRMSKKAEIYFQKKIHKIIVNLLTCCHESRKYDLFKKKIEELTLENAYPIISPLSLGLRHTISVYYHMYLFTKYFKKKSQNTI